MIGDLINNQIVDEEGLEMITLDEDEFDPQTGQRKELPDLRKKRLKEEEEQKEEGMMFRKTKSNNFFSVDDSADQIQPFEDDENDQPESPLKEETEPKQVLTQPDEVPPEDDILRQIEQTLKEAEATAKQMQNNSALPGLNDLPNLNDL